jgi:hypothetical protein
LSIMPSSEARIVSAILLSPFPSHPSEEPGPFFRRDDGRITEVHFNAVRNRPRARSGGTSVSRKSRTLAWRASSDVTGRSRHLLSVPSFHKAIVVVSRCHDAFGRCGPPPRRKPQDGPVSGRRTAAS